MPQSLEISLPEMSSCTDWVSPIITVLSRSIKVSVCACVRVCQSQRKTKDRADGMSKKKKCPFPSRGFEPVPLGYMPTVLPITPRVQACLASVQANTSDPHPAAPSRNTSMHYETLQLLSVGPWQPSGVSRTSTESNEACQRKTKDGADSESEKVHFPLDRIRNCTSGICAQRASDYTTRAGTLLVSLSKHFTHPPAPSWNTSMRCDTLQLLSVCVCVRAWQVPPASLYVCLTFLKTPWPRELHTEFSPYVCFQVNFHEHHPHLQRHNRGLQLLVSRKGDLTLSMVTQAISYCAYLWTLRRGNDWPFSWPGLCALRHGIQNSIEASLACDPAVSTKYLGWVAMGAVRIRHSIREFATQPVILWILLGGKPTWLPLNFGFDDVMRTAPISCEQWPTRDPL